jgi:hypothetical protein
MIYKEKLNDLYTKQKLSMKDISVLLKCSQNQVDYWMKKHNIKRRSISEGVYIKNNPKGDPFLFRGPEVKKDSILYGVGLGLYWGEGTKANKNSIRLGNTDPDLILTFIEFLKVCFSIDKKDLRFGLQIFSEMSEKEALDFWCAFLDVSKKQFMKTVITISNKKGTYTHKIKHGVLTVYFNNTKARNQLCSLIEKRRKKV